MLMINAFSHMRSGYPSKDNTGITATETEGIFQHILLVELTGSIRHTVQDQFGIRCVVDGRGYDALQHAFHGKNSFYGTGCPHGVPN